MSANKENNLVQAYIELNKFCQSGDYDRALKATGKSEYTCFMYGFYISSYTISAQLTP